jgi:hypothetical protein
MAQGPTQWDLREGVKWQSQPDSCKKKLMKSQERLILLGDKLIFMIKLDLTEGEVPPHPNPPPPRGEGGVGEDNQVSLLCNVRVNC